MQIRISQVARFSEFLARLSGEGEGEDIRAPRLSNPPHIALSGFFLPA
jgi:hypothetical protein